MSYCHSDLIQTQREEEGVQKNPQILHMEGDCPRNFWSFRRSLHVLRRQWSGHLQLRHPHPPLPRLREGGHAHLDITDGR